jgi:hypothetical protein
VTYESTDTMEAIRNVNKPTTIQDKQYSIQLSTHMRISTNVYFTSKRINAEGIPLVKFHNNPSERTDSR